MYQVLQILDILYSTIFGRRLGTVDDGTSLRTNPHTPGSIDLDPATIEHFTPNTRDLTLTRPSIGIDYTSRVRRVIDGQIVKQGYAYAGPKFGTLNKFANTVFGTSSPGSKITFERLNEILVQGTRSPLNGRSGVFLMTSDEGGQLIKTDFAMPVYFAVSQESFDNTVTNFGQTLLTFDDTTP